MKKYKQFRAEQQYITEVGPFASAMMVAMGAVGLGVAGWKLFKVGKEKIKGYRETKAEKKANRESGVEIEVKKINPETGEEYEELVTLSGSKANLDSDGVEKKRKELQKKYDNSDRGRDKASANEKIRAVLGKGPNDIITKDDQKAGMAQLKDPEGTKKAEKEKKEKETSDVEDKTAKEKRAGIEDAGDAEEYFDKNRSAPEGWEDVRTDNERDKEHDDYIDFKGKILTNKDAEAYRQKKERLADKRSDEKKAEDEKKDAEIAQRKKEKKDAKKKKEEEEAAKKDNETTNKKESRLLNFGEFISEGVMNDLLKAGKSKKDSEISLDDGADIPIDPLTSQILVKYIEGLSSSEKNRTIQQIQRTERAFMKVLGKAHENT